jgi:hypothetical protein
MITVERKVDFSRARRGRKQIHGGRDRSKQMQKGADAPAISTGRVPRVSRLMALAIRLDRLIHDGVVTDQAELARLGHVTRTRLTQIMNLLNLAPEIQEELLFLATTEQGRDAVTEKQLRPIAAVQDWRKQRRMWVHRSVTATPK